MNKSTPLSQLPNAMQQQTSFVSDQQKQMITNAQQAINNISMPQNTQIPNDIINDDDATIQEVLNHINLSQSQQQPQLPQQQQVQQQMPIHKQMDMNQYMSQQMQQPYDIDAALSNQMAMQNLMQQMPQQPQSAMAVHTGSSIEMFFHMFGDDLKLAILILTMIILVHFIPIGSILGRYIAIDKIPYHDILLKALLASILVVLTKKLVVK